MRYLLLLVAFLVTPASAQEYTNELPEAKEEVLGECKWPGQSVLDAVVKVGIDDERYASGWVYATNRVVTAEHVADAIGDKAALIFGDDPWGGWLIGDNSSRDTAIYKAYTSGIDPIPWFEGELEPGEKTWAVGFPMSTSMPYVTEGKFQGWNSNDDRLRRASVKGDKAFMSDSNIWFGNSGGPMLVCREGQFYVAGMNVAILGRASHLAIVVSAEEVRRGIDIIERLRDKPENSLVIGP